MTKAELAALNLGLEKKGAFPKIRVGPVVLGFVTLLLLCLLALLYLSQANSMALKGYEIKDLEKKIESLQKTNKQLELEAAELQSIEKIENDVKKLNLEKVSNVSYLTEAGSEGIAVSR